MTGGAAANALAKEADLVIAVGSRLTDFTTASKWGFQHPDVKLLGVNVCAFDALKMDAQTVIADAKETLSALLPALAETGYQAQWGGRIREVKDAFTAEVDRQYAVDLPEGLSQTRALGEINRAIAQDSIIVGSSGSLPGCLQRLWRPGAKHTYHLEYGFSCMGYEICGALGVKLAEPEKEVYAMVGDGSFLMLHSELYTAVQEGAKINVLLFDNTGWGCIENLQNEQGTETFGTRFTRRNPETGLLDGAVVPIDFAKCAAGYGCKTYTGHKCGGAARGAGGRKTADRADAHRHQGCPRQHEPWVRRMVARGRGGGFRKRNRAKGLRRDAGKHQKSAVILNIQ